VAVSLGSGHFPLDIFPPNMLPLGISATRTIPSPLSHDVGHSPLPYHHHHAPVYIKRSTVKVYKIILLIVVRARNVG